MIFRLDLTIEQKDDLINYLSGLISSKQFHTFNSYIGVTSIELESDSFLIKYKKYVERTGSIETTQMIIEKTAQFETPGRPSEYDVIMDWFKPKMRDYKLEELGI
jgi:hypothetical protein